jgi:poly-gamma-glutamate capsule biosynthesis protein CapA/YwtB (metallophosphatase superfamily)
MNRSYSKIRHIQESNQILEKRILKEQTSDVYKNVAAGVAAGAGTGAGTGVAEEVPKTVREQVVVAAGI